MTKPDLDRYVFFKCNDCNKAFWKVPLLPPRDNIMQHMCFNNGISTRRFGTTAAVCTRDHPNLDCLVKISKDDYSSQLNCGKYATYLDNLTKPNGLKRKTRSRRRKSSKSRAKKARGRPIRKERTRTRNSAAPKPMSEAVKSILVQNELVHMRKKQKAKKKGKEISKSVWDPGSDDGDFNTQTRAVISNQSNKAGASNHKEFSVNEVPSTSVPSVKSKQRITKAPKRALKNKQRTTSLSKRQNITPKERKRSFPSPDPVAEFYEWSESESGSCREPIVPTIEDLINHGLSDLDEEEYEEMILPFTQEEENILAEIDSRINQEGQVNLC